MPEGDARALTQAVQGRLGGARGGQTLTAALPRRSGRIRVGTGAGTGTDAVYYDRRFRVLLWLKTPRVLVSRYVHFMAER